MKYGLSDKNINIIKHIFKKYDAIDTVILYGSRARGNYHEGSDIDLTLHGENLDLKTLNKIRNDLDDTLLPYKFDLSIFRTIENQDILDHIKRIGITFYKNENKNDE
jgi:predicted nucleotidyltransferase